MFEPREIDLFERVVVDDAVTVMSLVRATVPVESGNVIVRSAVGSVIARVVSKSFAVAPSNVILEPKAGLTVELISEK